jgi:hypothetical protein
MPNPFLAPNFQDTAKFAKDYFESDLNQVISGKKESKISYLDDNPLANQVIKISSTDKKPLRSEIMQSLNHPKSPGVNV